MTREFEELVQREIDDDLDPAERTELMAALAADPVLRARREEMLSLAGDLRDLGWQEPAPGLDQRIMEAIEAEPAHGPAARRHRPRRARLRPDTGQILAFAAGLVLMFAASRLILPTVDADQAAGTLLPPDAGALASGSLDAPGARIEARTTREDERLYLSAHGDQSTPRPVHVDWNDGAWSVRSVRSTGPGDLTLEPGQARFVQDEPGPFTLEMEFQLRRTDSIAGDVRLRLADPDGGPEPLSLGTARDDPDR